MTRLAFLHLEIARRVTYLNITSKDILQNVQQYMQDANGPPIFKIHILAQFVSNQFSK